MSPVQLRLDRERELYIQWADGRESVIPLAVLRRMCPCAACREERSGAGRSGLPLMASREQQARMARAEKAELTGHYGLRITWQDGHAAGIYDYELLRELGANPGEADPRRPT